MPFKTQKYVLWLALTVLNKDGPYRNADICISTQEVADLLAITVNFKNEKSGHRAVFASNPSFELLWALSLIFQKLVVDKHSHHRKLNLRCG